MSSSSSSHPSLSHHHVIPSFDAMSDLASLKEGVRLWDNECVTLFAKPRPLLWSFVMQNMGYLRMCYDHEPSKCHCESLAHPLYNFLSCVRALLSYYGSESARTLDTFRFCITSKKMYEQVILFEILDRHADDILTIHNYCSMHKCFRSYFRDQGCADDLTLFEHVFRIQDYRPKLLPIPLLSELFFIVRNGDVYSTDHSFGGIVEPQYVFVHTKRACSFLHHPCWKRGDEESKSKSFIFEKCTACETSKVEEVTVIKPAITIQVIFDVQSNMNAAYLESLLPHKFELASCSFGVREGGLELFGVLLYSLFREQEAKKIAFLLGLL